MNREVINHRGISFFVEQVGIKGQLHWIGEPLTDEMQKALEELRYLTDNPSLMYRDSASFPNPSGQGAKEIVIGDMKRDIDEIISGGLVIKLAQKIREVLETAEDFIQKFDGCPTGKSE